MTKWRDRRETIVVSTRFVSASDVTADEGVSHPRAQYSPLLFLVSWLAGTSQTSVLGKCRWNLSKTKEFDVIVSIVARKRVGNCMSPLA